MTSINLHGILAREYGDTMIMKIRKPKEVFNAIDANKPNFIKRILNLSSEGIHYNIVVDGKNIKELSELEVKKEVERIDIVPSIVGSGKVGGAIMIVIGVAMMVTGFGAPIGAMLIGMGVQMMMAPKPETVKPESNLNGTKESFLFSSKANVTQQGIPVPVGYGRLRVGSAIIQTTMKSYPQNYVQNLAMQNTLDYGLVNADNGLVTSYI
jgi:predicted phage tail protein